MGYDNTWPRVQTIWLTSLFVALSVGRPEDASGARCAKYLVDNGGRTCSVMQDAWNSDVDVNVLLCLLLCDCSK